MPAGPIRSPRPRKPLTTSGIASVGRVIVVARGRRERRAAISGAGDPVEDVRALLLNNVLVERLSRTFRALGDPTRSKMVLVLSLREMCVSELARALGASLSATSHQLRILRDLDLVRVRRSGRSQLYVLNEQAFGPCSPRSCMAWRQTLAPGPARGERRRALAWNENQAAAPGGASPARPVRAARRRHGGGKG